VLSGRAGHAAYGARPSQAHHRYTRPITIALVPEQSDPRIAHVKVAGGHLVGHPLVRGEVVTLNAEPVWVPPPTSRFRYTRGPTR
jgi:hypothetical protein